jgi:heme/copper-type cytochrome/quinol oxidase subunit 1
MTAPALFLAGFMFIFVLGGLTGVMVALLPFDWQAHDTYFIVAHLHYVLVGGMVFPVFAALYYWLPLVKGQRLSERVAKWAFWLMFGGFNIAFFPMHVTGLLGMPRRVYTYPAEMGWDGLNMASTIGAFVLAAGCCCSWLMPCARCAGPSSRSAIRGMRRPSNGCRPKTTARAASRKCTIRRSAVGPAGPGRTGRSRPALPARHRERRTRDDRHQPGRG